MKHLFTKCACVLSAIALSSVCFPQKAYAETQAAVQTDSSIPWDTVLEYTLAVLIIAAILFVIGHMIYMKFIKKPDGAFSDEQFKQMRVDAGLPTEALEQENAQAMELLQKGRANWRIVPDLDDNEPVPVKTKHMKEARRAVAAIIELKPTDAAAIEGLNDLIGELNFYSSRSFYGSKPLLWTVGIVGAIISLIIGFSASWATCIAIVLFFAVNILIYVLACQVPTYLIIKRTMKGGNHASTGFIAGVLGMVAGSTTKTVVTKWSDGSTTREVDDSETQTNIIIMIILFTMLAFCIFVLALWNYLRNYVFYI